MAGPGPDAAGLTSARLRARGIRPATVIKWLRATFRGGPKFSLLFLSIAMIWAVFAPVIAPYDPLRGSLRDAFLPPSISIHPLGTDNQGRDVLSRIIHGARISVTIGVLGGSPMASFPSPF